MVCHRRDGGAVFGFSQSDAYFVKSLSAASELGLESARLLDSTKRNDRLFITTIVLAGALTVALSVAIAFQ
jgi:hypothetical protein